MKELRIVCSAPPEHGVSNFLDCENEKGQSVRVGEWRERKDRLWELVVIVDTLR